MTGGEREEAALLIKIYESQRCDGYTWKLFQMPNLASVKIAFIYPEGRNFHLALYARIYLTARLVARIIRSYLMENYLALFE